MGEWSLHDIMPFNSHGIKPKKTKQANKTATTKNHSNYKTICWAWNKAEISSSDIWFFSDVLFHYMTEKVADRCKRFRQVSSWGESKYRWVILSSSRNIEKSTEVVKRTNWKERLRACMVWSSLQLKATWRCAEILHIVLDYASIDFIN